jgi:YHS domain-containing protein
MSRLFFFCFISLLSFGQVQNTTKGLGINGYDPVSYFEGKAEKGLVQFQIKSKGVTYRFTSEDHMTLFGKNPNAYSPQYGGWCAYAMGLDGSKVEINPESYKVIDGRLYLFFKTRFVETKSKWDRNEVSLMTKADQNWSKEP